MRSYLAYVRDHGARPAAQAKGSAPGDGRFVDRRPTAATMAATAAMMNNSPRALQMAVMEERIGASRRQLAQRRQIDAMAGSGGAIVQREDIDATQAPAEQVVPPSSQAAGSSAPEGREPERRAGSLPTDPEDKQAVQDKAIEVDSRIDEILAAASDSATIELQLMALQKAYQLKNIELLGAGTPQARVRYEINPTYEKHIGGGDQITYRMLGSGSDEFRSNVLFIPGSLTVNGVSDTVGKEMIANPLSQDHQAGSEPSKSVQSDLMAELPNAGNKKVANPLKYIKGHLLNADLGGPGNAINMYPITADANAKHLAFVEKFVKSSVLAGYVVYYRVNVTHEETNNTNQPDADMEFDFFRYDVNGKPVQNSRHQGSVQSRFGTPGAAPYTVEDEFERVDGEPEYDKLNRDKRTPKAQSLGDEAESRKSGYKLSHSGSQSFSTAKTNDSKALPTRYGSSKSCFMYNVTGAADYGAARSGVVQTCQGRFLLSVNTDDSEYAKGWHWVTLVDADNQQINIGHSWLMTRAAISRGNAIEDGTPFKRPLNIASSLDRGRANEIETFGRGAYFKTSSLSKQEWTRVEILHSVDPGLQGGEIGWMKSRWLSK